MIWLVDCSGTPTLTYLDPSCGVPVNEYLWLNDLHPTYPMHNLIASQIVQQITSWIDWSSRWTAILPNRWWALVQRRKAYGIEVVGLQSAGFAWFAPDTLFDFASCHFDIIWKVTAPEHRVVINNYTCFNKSQKLLGAWTWLLVNDKTAPRKWISHLIQRVSKSGLERTILLLGNMPFSSLQRLLRLCFNMNIKPGQMILCA